MIRSNLRDYSDECIHIKLTITIPNTAVAGAAASNSNKIVLFKTCAPFTKCLSGIINTQVEDAHDIDVVMSMYNLIECSDIYSKISGCL